MQYLAVVVEDDNAMRTIYRRVLEDIGYTVIEAGDGNTAIKLLRDHTPDIIFLDMLLPYVNGLTVLDYILNAEHLNRMHVVIVTSNRQFEKDIENQRHIDFILKPIRPAQIRDLARAALVE